MNLLLWFFSSFFSFWSCEICRILSLYSLEFEEVSFEFRLQRLEAKLFVGIQMEVL